MQNSVCVVEFTFRRSQATWFVRRSRGTRVVRRSRGTRFVRRSRGTWFVRRSRGTWFVKTHFQPVELTMRLKPSFRRQNQSRDCTQYSLLTFVGKTLSYLSHSPLFPAQDVSVCVSPALQSLAPSGGASPVLPPLVRHPSHSPFG